MATLSGSSYRGHPTKQQPRHSSLQSIDRTPIWQGAGRLNGEEEGEMKGSVTLDLERSREEVAQA